MARKIRVDFFLTVPITCRVIWSKCYLVPLVVPATTSKMYKSPEKTLFQKNLKFVHFQAHCIMLLLLLLRVTVGVLFRSVNMLHFFGTLNHAQTESSKYCGKIPEKEKRRLAPSVSRRQRRRKRNSALSTQR